MVCILAACNERSDTTTLSKTDTTGTSVDTLTAVTKTPQDTKTEDMLKPSAIDNKAWEMKKANGIAWLGIGTEPFWSIERKNDSLIFQLSDWEKPVILKALRTSNSKDSVVYVSESLSQKLRTTIIPGECSDGMSDRKYDYSIKVVYNAAAYKGCAVIL
jgi:uncharacterized membrane protein